jgi:DNA-binding transcriptional ArsR family regulator
LSDILGRSAGSRGLAHAAPVFSALGDERRLALVARLSTGEGLSIARLAAGSPITRQAVTKHLNVLAEAGLVRHAKRGRERIWELNGQRLEEARRCLDQISKQWDQALERLKNLVERGG